MGVVRGGKCALASTKSSFRTVKSLRHLLNNMMDEGLRICIVNGGRHFFFCAWINFSAYMADVPKVVLRIVRGWVASAILSGRP